MTELVFYSINFIYLFSEHNNFHIIANLMSIQPMVNTKIYKGKNFIEMVLLVYEKFVIAIKLPKCIIIRCASSLSLIALNFKGEW